jgi:guanylate kinase
MFRVAGAVGDVASQEVDEALAGSTLQPFPADRKLGRHPVEQQGHGLSLKRRGLLFVLSSPSGAGKSTIARMLLEATTASPVRLRDHPPDPPGRGGRRDYHFVTDAEFDRDGGDGEFLEWAHVFGHRYGTLKSEVVKQIEGGRDVLLDIDWQGTQQLKQVDPDIVRVFILPPSMEELERRLRTRGTDSDEVIRGRMARAAGRDQPLGRI